MITTSNFARVGSIPFPVQISRKSFQFAQKANIPTYPDLFPSEQLLNDFLECKRQGGSFQLEEYKKRYFAETLSKLDPVAVYADIMSTFGEHATLICHCGDYSSCHRRLVSEWLSNATGHEVRELLFNDPNKMPWKPQMILIHDEVANDFVTTNILINCPGVPFEYVYSGDSEELKKKFESFYNESALMVSNINAGKELLYISPMGKAVDPFEMPDPRMNCPEFCKINFAPNGCYYRCEWCFLKATYREMRSFITIRAQHKLLKEQILAYLRSVKTPIMFNSGEMSDSLALEHLSMFGREIIPWFAKLKHSHLFMLTKSDNVDYILDLPHRGYTTVAWSLNEPSVSRMFEVGAPTFERRLKAAKKVQDAGYPVRIRIDPIVPIHGWQSAYALMIKKIFEFINPERITIGTLRFEDAFFKNKHNYIHEGSELLEYLSSMNPMLEKRIVRDKGKEKQSVGKISFPEKQRVAMFDFIIKEIRKHNPNIIIALCKEISPVWLAVGLDPNKIQCACQIGRERA